MPNEILIRTAIAADAPALGHLIESVHRLHAAARPDVFKPTARADLETWARQALTSSRTHIVVAEVGDALAGYAALLDEQRADNVFGYHRRWRVVEQLGVHPDHRHRGVARALLDDIAATARADGIPALELDTWVFNREAQAAFERLGFVAKTIRFEKLGD